MGVREGLRVGECVGDKDGERVVIVGVQVGERERLLLGDLVGFLVGEMVGDEVVGDKVGEVVGVLEGRPVGD